VDKQAGRHPVLGRIRRALTPRDPLYRWESAAGRRRALCWKLAGLAAVLGLYAIWLYRLWALSERGPRHGWKLGVLTVTLLSASFALFALASFLLAFRSMRGELSAGTAEALVLTSASRYRLVLAKLRGALEILPVVALLLPLYCLAGIADDSGGQVEAYVHGGPLRLLVLGDRWDYAPSLLAGVLTGVGALLSDLTWFVLLAACGVWAAVSRRHWVSVVVKGLVVAALALVLLTMAGYAGMQISSPLPFRGHGFHDEEPSFLRELPNYFRDMPTDANPGWLALLVVAACMAARLLLAQFLLLRAAARFDVIALDPDRPRRWLKPGFWRKTALVASGAVLILAAAACLWLRHVDREHERLLAEARARLLALNFEPPPKEENAAPLYEKAFGQFANNPRDYGTKFTTPLAFFDLEIGSAEIAKLLKDEAAALATLEQAAAKPQCVFVSDYSRGAYTKLPSLYNARAACLLLSVAARRHARDGDYARAVLCVEQMLHLARGTGQPRFLISNMVMCAEEAIACLAIRDILTQTEPDEASLRKMLAVLEEHCRLAPSCREALQVEHVVGAFHAAEIAAHGDKDDRGADWGRVAYWLRRSAGMVLRDGRNFEALNTRVDEAMALPSGEVYRRLVWLAKHSDLERQQESLKHPYTLVTISPLSGARSAIECRTLLHCARLAVACRLEQIGTGRLPARLTELSGYFPADFAEVMTDPFSGRQLLYKLSESGFIVYSVGPDQPWDNGAPNPYLGSYEPDLCFPVDRQLWEEYRSRRIQMNQRLKASRSAAPTSGPRPPKAPRK